MSAFKQLYSAMMDAGGDAAAAVKAVGGKKTIMCYVKESFPYFLVADEHFYVPAYFTSKAVSDFKAKNSSVNVSDLKGSVVSLTDWGLELSRSSSWTSYAGLEIRLVVRAFKLGDGPKAGSNASNAHNLYRDAEVKTRFNNFVHGAVQGKAPKGDSLPDPGKKGSASDGVVSCSGDRFSFKDTKTATMDMVAVYKSEKGGAKAPSAKSASGGVRAVGGAKKKASAKKSGAARPSVPTSAIVKKAASKTPAHNKKKSVARPGTAGGMASPGNTASSRATPGMSKAALGQLKAYLKKSGK